MEKAVLLTRRRFLFMGGALISSAWLAPNPCLAADFDWPTWFSKKKPRGGKGLILKVEGLVTVQGRAVKPGDMINDGDRIQGGLDTTLIFRCPDNAVIKMNGDMNCIMEIGAETGGVLSVIKGAVLAIIPKRKQYTVVMPTAVLGVRGTVFYREVLQRDKLALVPGTVVPAMGCAPGNVIPVDALDYFCLCNGELDYLTPDLTQKKPISATYHESFFLLADQAGALLKPTDQVLNHTDQEILNLATYQMEPRHDMEWIYEARRNRNNYGGY